MARLFTLRLLSPKLAPVQLIVPVLLKNTPLLVPAKIERPDTARLLIFISVKPVLAPVHKVPLLMLTNTPPPLVPAYSVLPSTAKQVTSVLVSPVLALAQVCPE